MNKLAERLVTPVLDCATLLIAWWALPALSAQLGRESSLNLLILLGAHGLMCGGLVLAKFIQSEPAGRSFSPSQMWLFGLSLPFSVAVMAMLVISGGLFDESTFVGAFIEEANDNGGAALVLPAILGFLLVLGALPTTLLYQPKGKLSKDSPAYWPIRIGSVLAVNAMVLVTAGFWEGYLADAESMGAGIPLRLMLTVVLYPIFVFFYAAPRLALLSLEPGRWSAAGFFIMLAVYVWQLTA